VYYLIPVPEEAASGAEVPQPPQPGYTAELQVEGSRRASTSRDRGRKPVCFKSLLAKRRDELRCRRLEEHGVDGVPGRTTLLICLAWWSCRDRLLVPIARGRYLAAQLAVKRRGATSCSRECEGRPTKRRPAVVSRGARSGVGGYRSSRLGTSTACCSSISSGTRSRTRSLVDASTTNAAAPSRCARSQFLAVTHHHHGSEAWKSVLGIGRYQVVADPA